MSVLKGIAHGRTIELESDLDLPDGAPIVVNVQRLLPPGEGIRLSAGAWADGGEALDHWLVEMQRSRQQERAEPTP
jgi:hypothetical protein